MIMIPSDLEVKVFYGAVQYFMFPALIDVQENGCWIPVGIYERGGYKSLNYEGKRQYAHRLSYCLNVEDIPVHPSDNTNDRILHHCDNKHCINPNHLYKGTMQQNTIDTYERNKEIRNKMSISRMGNTNSLGYKHSEETTRKKTAHLIGNKYRLGKKLSKETIAKRTKTMQENKAKKRKASENVL